MLLTGVRRDIIYPPEGAKLAATTVLDGLRTDDVILVSRRQAFSFALASDEPYDLEPHADRLVGFAPAFDDPRLVSLHHGMTTQELAASVEGAQRVRIIHMVNVEDEEARQYGTRLLSLGFAPVESERIGGSIVTTFTR